ncbi:hypothetical protein N9L92_03360, partial [Saprospiraceae bacterium]|nr:hypothetical protein [Saprospiraceae bacterium]
MKRIFKVLFVILILLLIFLFVAPIIFKDQIIEAVKNGINENVNAEVDFADADVSLIRNFPSLSVELSDFSILGKQPFAGVPLVKAKQIFLSTDWKSVIKSDEGITISKIYLDEPYVNIIVDKDGNANYDVTEPSSESTSESSFFGEIESYEIEDGTILYTDQVGGTKASIYGLNHNGNGKFKDVNFDLATKTDIEEINFSQGGIPYLKKSKANAEITLGIDMDKQMYTFKDNVVKLNDLSLAFEGFAQLLNEGYNVDLKINAANNSVASILSLIPSVYTSDYGNIKSSGTGSLSGSIAGVFNSEKEQYPKVDLKVNLDNGQIQYPALKIPIKDIFLDMAIKSNKADLSDLAINIPAYSFILDEDKVNGTLNVTNVLGDPHIKSNTTGKLDLYKLSQAYPFEAMTLRSGIVEGNIGIDAKQSDVTSEKYENITLDGQVTATNIDMDYTKDMPVKIDKIESTFSPKSLDAKAGLIQFGKSDFAGTVKVKDPLKMVVGGGQPTTNINMKSKVLNLDELMLLSEANATATDTILPQEVPFTNYVFNADYTVDKVVYEDYDIANMTVQGGYKDETLSLTKSSLSLDKSPISARGKFNNIMHYVFNEETLSGELFFDANELNANKYINDTENTEVIEQVVEVPANLDLKIYPKIKTLIYDNYTLSNIDGKIAVKDGIAGITDGVANLFHGTINFEGAYNTQDIKNPLFDFKYKIDKMNFTEVFEKNETFKVLAPLAKYMEGIFNSTLTLSGPLTKEMVPDLYKLDATGFMETINTKIEGFKPLEMLGNALGINQLKEWDIKDSKNWFKIQEGSVVVMPHDYDIQDMQFTVGGKHSIDQILDYNINARIPRERLSKAQVGKTLDMGLSTIEQQASSKGINIDLGDFIYLDAHITGTLLKPKIKITPVGSGGKSLTDVLKDQFTQKTTILKDTLTKEVTKKVNEAKDTVAKVIKAKTDTLKAVAKKEIDKKTQEAKDAIAAQAKAKLDSTIAQGVKDSLAKVAKDNLGGVLGKGGGSQVDS